MPKGRDKIEDGKGRRSASKSASALAPDQEPTPAKGDPFRVPGHPEARVPGKVGPQTPDRVMANRECRDT